MNWAQTTTRTIDLGYEQLLTFVGRPGTRIRVLFGSMWLTEEGCAQDVFAGCGDEVTLKSGGLSVIEGLGAARVQVIDPARRAWRVSIVDKAQRVWQALRPRVQARDVLARLVILVLALAVSASVLHLSAPGLLSIRSDATHEAARSKQPSGPAASVLTDLAAARTGFLAVN